MWLKKFCRVCFAVKKTDFHDNRIVILCYFFPWPNAFTVFRAPLVNRLEQSVVSALLASAAKYLVCTPITLSGTFSGIEKLNKKDTERTLQTRYEERFPCSNNFWFHSSMLSNIFLSSSSVQIIAVGIQLTYRFTSYTSKIGSMCNILRKGGKERKKVFTPPFSDCFISS